MISRLPICRASALLLIACSIAAANGEQPTFKDLVDSLNSPEFSVREEATRSLATRDDIKQSDIENALKSPSASPEQRSRLALAARDRFARSPRAALGVEFAQNNALQNQAIISRTIPGFPSNKELLPGDEILALNGKEANREIARAVFRPIIISREPGDLLQMRILRDGQVIEREVPVGRYDDLRNPGGGSPLLRDDLPLAWRARSEDYPLAPRIGPLECGLPLDAWVAVNQRATGPLPMVRQAAEAIVGATVSPGGQLNGPLPVTNAMLNSPQDDIQLQGFNGGMAWQGKQGPGGQTVLQIRPGNRLQLTGPAGFAGQNLNQPDPFADQLTALSITRDQLKRRAMSHAATAADVGQPEAVRRQAKVQQNVAEGQMRAMDAQIENLRRIMQDRVRRP